MRCVSSPALRSCADPLAAAFDVALLDLDGVVYLGAEVIDGVPCTLRSARSAGMRLAFVTNNAARPPAAVAQLLQGMGIPADPAEVVTSAQAAAHHLAERLPARARVLVVGTVGLDEALRERGLVPVYQADEQPEAVVQGYSPSLDWPQLAEGAVAIRRGVPWVATNLDATVPSPRGPLPGNGSMIAALEHATGCTPVATGKPDPTMHRESVQRSHARQPLVVGDRLDTDIEGANAAGCPSLLVLTGVTTPGVLLAASRALRPSFVARDLTGLLRAHEAPVLSAGVARCGSWQASVDPDGAVVLADEPGTCERGESRGTGTDEPSSMPALRALCAAVWSTDAGGQGRAAPLVRAHSERAAAALRSLGLG